MISPPPSKAGALDIAKLDKTLADAIRGILLSPAYIEFLTGVYEGVQATQSSVTTADRPTKNLFIGRFYFDTSLGARGKPIWISKDGSTWIDATGAAV